MHDRRGIGRYVRSLIGAWTTRLASQIEIVLLVPHRLPAFVARRFREAARAPELAVEHRSHTSGVDLIWFPWNGMTWTPRRPSVVTVHDVWPFVSPSDDPLKRKREQSHYRLAAERAARFIAVSRFTAGELALHLPIDAARIDVVQNGVGKLATGDVVPAEIDGAQRYVLAVGVAEPRKGLATLLEAAALLPDSLLSSTAFVVAGKPDRAMPQHLRERSIRLEVAGEVSDERLASLYAGASAFVFPSRYEGFGLPVLEAMCYGAPVIASDAPAVAETAGGCALSFPAGDAAALAAALEQLLGDRSLALRLASAGRARAAALTVDRCAERTLEVFRRALAG